MAPCATSLRKTPPPPKLPRLPTSCCAVGGGGGFSSGAGVADSSLLPSNSSSSERDAGRGPNLGCNSIDRTVLTSALTLALTHSQKTRP